MAGKRSFRLRGIAAPILVGRPLLVRLCSEFVDNLTMILRIALVAGAVFLVQELRGISEDITQPLAELETAPADSGDEVMPVSPSEAREGVLSEGVKQALNCTYENYRNAHYSECIEEPSRIYLPPQADPDDTGQVRHDLSTLYARLDESVVPR